MSEKMKQMRLFLCLHLLFIGYAVGGIFSKKAGMAEFLSKEYVLNYIFFLIVLVVYAFFWQQILKKMSLTVAMANKSVTVIWGIVYGYLFFNETITFNNLLGAVVIIVGIWIVVSADKEEEVCM